MKSSLLTLVVLLTGWNVAIGQVFKNSDLVISKLEDKVWVIETTDKTTMYLIEGNDKALLIDTGTKCADLDKVVKQITKKPLYVVITHAHGDHDGNIGNFSKIFMHAADTVLMSKTYKGKIRFVKDGDQFDLGGKQIEVSFMPAHTPGSIVLLDKNAGSCYSGDAFGSGQVWLQLRPFAPMKTYINSLKKMELLMDNGITKIYCGHYPYLKKALGKEYISTMRKLAESLDNGTAKGAIPFTRKVSIGAVNPMIITDGEASIVYDPEHIK